MGISGLDKFVKKNFEGWQRKQVRGTLVLDGDNVSYYLHSHNSIPWWHGGQYSHFFDVAIKFIERLESCGISPIFVFDGIGDYRLQKEKTIINRFVDSTNKVEDKLQRPEADQKYPSVQPVLASEVLLCALRERNVPFYYVDGEGDRETAALANHHNCPVVSGDSDFYMFDIPGGLISTEQIQYWWEESTTIIEADVYFKHKFVEHFKLVPELCLAVPAILGNDFIEELYHGALEYVVGTHRQGKIRSLMRYLSLFKSFGHLLEHIKSQPDGTACSHKLMEKYKQAKDIYSNLPVITEDTLMEETTLELRDSTPLPRWVLREYRKGCFKTSLMKVLMIHKCILDFVPDDVQQESAHTCSRPIRQAIYGMLEEPAESLTVEEITRVRFDFVSVPVQRVFQVGDVQLPNILSIESMTLAERRSILYAILRCDDLDHLEHKWQLVVAASYFWVRATKPSKKQIECLVLTFLKCSAGQSTSPNTRRHEEPKSPQWMKSFHCYAQWQCVYLDTMKLNNLLKNPFFCESPALLFDGEMVMDYVFHNIDRIVERVVSELGQEELYHLLVSTISAGLPEQQETNLPQSTNSQSNPVPGTSTDVFCNVPVSNRYGPLLHSDD